MKSLFRSLVALSALALSGAAYADTFSGTAVFSDLNNPNTNDVVFTGSFANPSFSFSGGAGTIYSNFLTITASTTQGGNGQIQGSDQLSVVLNFTLPNANGDSVSGTGTITGNTSNASGTITWNDAIINFSDGSSLLAHIPDFTFSSANLRDGRTTTIGGNLDLTVQTDATVQTTTPAVPEPSSIALMGTGVLAAAGAIRRRIRI